MAAAPDKVAVEEPLEIRLRGEPFQVLMRLPGWEKELALGFLYTEGIVRDLNEVITMHFCGTATDPLLPPNVVDVQLTDAAWERRGRRHLEVAYSSCGLCAKVAVSEICCNTAPVGSALTGYCPGAPGSHGTDVSGADRISGDGRHPWRGSGDPRKRLFSAGRDVGRHNAMDKVFGRALLQRRDLSGMVALLSGRISFEMALKAIRGANSHLARCQPPLPWP